MTNWFLVVPTGSGNRGVVSGAQVVPVVPHLLGGNQILGTGTRDSGNARNQDSAVPNGNRVAVVRECVEMWGIDGSTPNPSPARAGNTKGNMTDTIGLTRLHKKAAVRVRDRMARRERRIRDSHKRWQIVSDLRLRRFRSIDGFLLLRSSTCDLYIATREGPGLTAEWIHPSWLGQPVQKSTPP